MLLPKCLLVQRRIKHYTLTITTVLDFRPQYYFGSQNKKEVFLHKVIARSSVCVINCYKQNHYHVHQTIIKRHCTLSNFLLCSLTKKSCSYSSLSLSSFLSCLFEGAPLLSMTADVSNGKSILNRHWCRMLLCLIPFLWASLLISLGYGYTLYYIIKTVADTHWFLM